MCTGHTTAIERMRLKPRGEGYLHLYYGVDSIDRKSKQSAGWKSEGIDNTKRA